MLGFFVELRNVRMHRLLSLFLLAGICIAVGCNNDRKVIEKHERALEVEEESLNNPPEPNE